MFFNYVWPIVFYLSICLYVLISQYYYIFMFTYRLRRVYPKFSGLAAWSENCKWYSSLPLGAVVSLFCESV
jgi:hypothetical protein